jgi:alkaline phosphatase
MTTHSIDLLAAASKRNKRGYFLMVESGRIDHAHHAANAQRSLIETVTLDRAVAAAIDRVDLAETLIIVTADHSHVFALAGYAMADADKLPYKINDAPSGYLERKHHGALDVIYTLDATRGDVRVATDANGTPYTMPGYLNGPGFRGASRVDPRVDPFPGVVGESPSGPDDVDYRQETARPRGSESHGAEDVVIYGIGSEAERIHGTVKNTYVFDVMKSALGL